MGAGWELGGRQAVCWPGQACRGRAAAARRGHKAGQCQAWPPPAGRPSSLPASLRAGHPRGGRAGTGPGPACRRGAVAAGRRQARRGGAQVCQGGETSPGLQIAALSFFFFTPPAWEREKKKKKLRFLWRRMQKGRRILTISCTGLSLSGVWARAGHGGPAGGD